MNFLEFEDYDSEDPFTDYNQTQDFLESNYYSDYDEIEEEEPLDIIPGVTLDEQEILRDQWD